MPSGDGDSAPARLGSIVRAFRAHEHRSAALLLGLLVLAYLWPALVEGRLLSPTALVYAQAPWNAIAPTSVGRWMNGDLGDVPYLYYPWAVLARHLIHAGTFPAWNPYAFGGTPLFANSEIAWLSPFSLPLWILPLNYAFGVAAALKLWLAGFGTYLLARELRLSFLPALLAAIAFALCSFNVVWLSYGIFVSVAALLPWALWLVEQIVRRGRPLDGLLLAGALTVALTSGHPGTELHIVAATGLYALMRVAMSGELARRERVRRLGLVGAGVAVAVLAAAVVLVPAQRTAIETFGAAARRNGASAFRGSRMPFEVLRTALFPDWWGRPSEGIALGPAAYRERTFYAGAATLVLGLIALSAPRGWRRKAPFALLGALGLAIALRLPGLYDLVIHTPGFDQIQNSRIYLWFVFAAALLAGFGLQHVLDARGQLGRGWIAPLAPLLVGVVAAVALSAEGAAWGTALHHLVDRRSGGHAPAALSLASVLLWSALAGALAALLWMLRARPRRAALVATLVVLLVAADMLHFAAGFNPMGPPSAVIPQRVPAIAFLQRHQGSARISGVLSVSADWTTLYGLRDVRGADVPLPTLRWMRLWQTMDPAVTPEDLSSFTPLSPRILGLLGARYVLTPPGTRLGFKDMRPVYQGREATVFEDDLAAPRAFVPSAVHVVSTADDEYATLGGPAFDPRREATLRAPELRGAPPAAANAGTARVVRETNASVTLRASLRRRGLVVLDDTWGPGWSVTVDGRAARPVQANAVLRGVVAPAGTHAIVWRYRVPGLALGAALSALGLAAALAWAGLLLGGVRRRRRAR